jgi:hypothetical protein
MKLNHKNYLLLLYNKQKSTYHRPKSADTEAATAMPQNISLFPLIEKDPLRFGDGSGGSDEVVT